MRVERSISGARYVVLEPVERETLERARGILERIRELAREGSALDIDTAVAVYTLESITAARDSFGYRAVELEP